MQSSFGAQTNRRKLISRSNACRILGHRRIRTSSREGCRGTFAMATKDYISSNNGDRKLQPKKPPFKFLVPLVYAPVLPLIRIGLRKQPVLRDRVFTVVLGAALLHGVYLVTDLYDVESK